MKKLYTLIALTLISRIAFATDVLNPGFENWSAGNPVDWYADNVPGSLIPIRQEPGGHSGMYSLKGSVVATSSGFNQPPFIINGTSGAGSPVTQDYTNLSFYLKTNIAGADYFFVSVLVYDASSNTIGYAIDSISANYPGFTAVDVPITYTSGGAVSATIQFGIQNNTGVTGTIGSYFIIDDVDLNFSTGVHELNTLNDLRVYPVPATNQLHIDMKNATMNNAEIMITDMEGRIVLSRKISNGSISGDENISIAELPRGIYSLAVKNNEAVITKRIVIER